MSRTPPRARRSRKIVTPEPSATRNRIIAAATLLLAASGGQGATIRHIALAAGVNSQLIYYYFHDKGGLLRAVLETAARRVDTLLTNAIQDDGSPQDLARFIAAWVMVTLEEAPTVRMLHRAMLEADETFGADIQRYAGAHAGQISSLIEAGIATGAFRSDLDSSSAVASLVGMVQYLALAEPILYESTKLKQGTEGREAMAQHTAELFLRGLAAR